AWPGTALVTRFDGTGIDVKLHDSGTNFFGVSIDGGAFTVLKTSKAKDTYTLASGLPAGPHDVVLAKRTESFVGAVRFEAFVPAAGGKLIATSAPYARRIEFIGDSITCGYGNEGEGPNCPFTADTENELLAYGALTARALDAEHHAIAYSGKGAYRDNGGSTASPMALLYDRVVADSAKSVWDFSWTADVVVINLGTNDFAKGDPGQNYVDGYQALITKVRQHHPDAFVVLALGPLLSGGNLTKARGYLESIVEDRTKDGDTRISLVEMATQKQSNGLGCDYHPSLTTHQLMADTMTAAIKQLTGW
ncbi:MAG: endo-1,4-beta-glucanase, partial [Myxococcales bacterium]